MKRSWAEILTEEIAEEIVVDFIAEEETIAVKIVVKEEEIM